MKFMSKKISQKLEKKSMSSSIFYLNGGEPQEKDDRFDRFMEGRFNSPMQNILMTKNAHNVVSQYFHRIEMSPEEISRKQKDVKSLAFPGSLMDLVFNSGNETLSQADQDNLYFMWKNSSDTNGKIGVNSGDISKAEKLMNRGYVIADNTKGRYQLTEKGRKVLIGKILGNDPKIEKNSLMKKTSSLKKFSLRKSDFEGDSAIINFGGVKSLLLRNTPENIRLLNSVGAEKYAKPDRINNWLTIALNDIPQLEESGLSNEDPSSVSDWVNDTQNYHKNVPRSNSPEERMPYGASSSNMMNKFSSSKILSIIEKSKKMKKESILNNGIDVMNDRGLKIKMIASDDTSRERGLMFSEPIKGDECALFVFDKPGNYSFWNRNVSFPIDVAFYDSEKKLIHVGQLDSHQEKSVGCGNNGVKYVVEAKKNWFKENGVHPGSSIYEILEKNSSI